MPGCALTPIFMAIISIVSRTWLSKPPQNFCCLLSDNLPCHQGGLARSSPTSGGTSGPPPQPSCQPHGPAERSPRASLLPLPLRPPPHPPAPGRPAGCPGGGESMLNGSTYFVTFFCAGDCLTFSPVTLCFLFDLIILFLILGQKF